MELVEMSPEVTGFVRNLVLAAAPDAWRDDDDWGRTKRIQSGLDVRADGLRLRTKRRWKQVKHGVWKQSEMRLENPQERLQLQVGFLPAENADETRYRVQLAARLRVSGRQQQWARGVRLYSVSAEGLADVAFQADITLKRELVSQEDGDALRILPTVESSELRLTGFRLQRVGHAKGAVVREIGRSLKSLVKRQVKRKGEGLTPKINAKIRKKPERFEVPLGVFSLLVAASDAP